jgi:hypothetical protein
MTAGEAVSRCIIIKRSAVSSLISDVIISKFELVWIDLVSISKDSKMRALEASKAI